MEFEFLVKALKEAIDDSGTQWIFWVKISSEWLRKVGFLYTSKYNSSYTGLTTTLHCADLHNRDHILMKPVLVINLEVKDNHEEAAIGARLTLDLCQEVCVCDALCQLHRVFCL